MPSGRRTLQQYPIAVRLPSCCLIGSQRMSCQRPRPTDGSRLRHPRWGWAVRFLLNSGKLGLGGSRRDSGVAVSIPLRAPTI